MDLYEAMRCAPTTRRFSNEPVAPEMLAGALDAARFAPSGGNRQGWRVIAVQDPELRRKLGVMYLPHWRAYVRRLGMEEVLEDPNSDPVMRRRIEGADLYARSLAEVPLHLVVGVRLDDLAVTDAELPRRSIVGGASIYPFVQNLLLALRAEGLGAAMTTLLVPAEDAVRELLGIPPEVILAAHIGVGRRSDPWPRKLARRPVSEFAFGDRWGRALPEP
jgi:nitroreductase